MSPVSACNQTVDTPVRFRRQIPYAALDDLRLGLAEIAYIALLAAQSKTFLPDWRWVRDQIGLCRRAQQAVLRQTKQCGYIHRSEQAAPFQHVDQTLGFDAAPRGQRSGYLIAFDPQPGMGWRQYAIFAWLRSHKDGRVETWRVAQRFGIAAKTVMRIIKPLREGGLVDLTLVHEAGRIKGHVLQIIDVSVKHTHEGSDKEDKNNPPKNDPPKNDPHTNKQSPLTASPNQSPLPTNTTPPGGYLPPGGGRRARQRDFIDLGLGQLDGSSLIDECFPYDWRQDAVRPYLPDRRFREDIRVATQGRIHEGLLSAEGLESARAMIAGLVCGGPYGDWPQGELAERIRAAAAVFLQALEDRIGKRPGTWLNSWVLISSRLAGYLFEDGDGRVFAEPQAEA